MCWEFDLQYSNVEVEHRADDWILTALINFIDKLINSYLLGYYELGSLWSK